VKFLTHGPGQSLGAAALPVPAKLSVAAWSSGRIIGSPGTDAIPSPRPAGVPQGITHRTAGAGYRGSEQAPELWFPSVYYYGRDSMSHAPVSVFSDNQMPMPAIDPKRLPAQMQVRPVFLRQTQVQQPWVASSYPSRGPGRDWLG
jgi:hypothetical protein